MDGLARKLIFIIASTMASEALGRLLENDSEYIDREDSLGTEFYNDKASYMPPVSWRSLWRESNFGFHANAGSLDVRRFDYQEDIKVHANPTGGVGLSFTQERRDDYVEERLEREVRISLNPFWLVRLSLLADGKTDKEFGDVGVALGIQADVNKKLEFHYWSVDHYYDSKKEFPEDDYVKKPWSAGGTFAWEFTDILWFNFEGEIDHPTVWERFSEHYTYEYWRKVLDSQIHLGGADGLFIDLTARNERKSEKKTWDETIAGNQSKSMMRYVDIYGAEISYGFTRNDVLTIGAQSIRRNSDFRSTADESLEVEQYEEVLAADNILREERGYYMTLAFGVTENAYLQFGGHVNDVSIEETTAEEIEVTEELESKFQSAWSYHVLEGTRVLLNASWDIDQLESDYPYDEETFKPWGGGNIQVISTF